MGSISVLPQRFCGNTVPTFIRVTLVGCIPAIITDTKTLQQAV